MRIIAEKTLSTKNIGRCLNLYQMEFILDENCDCTQAVELLHKRYPPGSPVAIRGISVSDHKISATLEIDSSD